MKGKGVGLHEDRVRVICHLPANNFKEERALRKVIQHLKEQRRAPAPVKGFTHSAIHPAGYQGYWWDSRRRDYVQDKVVLFIIDYPMSFDDERVSGTVALLKKTIKGMYQRYGCPQDEIWVVAHQVIRQD